MTWPRRTAVLLAVGLITACSLVTAPDEVSITPAIVLTVPEEFGPVLAQVNRVHVQIKRPGGAFRDTVLSPVFRDDRIHARAVLRPSEGAPGTAVNIDLKNHDAFLFRGSVVIGDESGWPFEVRVPVAPVAVFDAGEDRSVTVGETVDLGQAATIRFDDDRVGTPDGVAWLSSDSAIVRMRGSVATAVAEGQTTVLGIWYGQIDTVAFDVASAAGISPPGFD